MYNYLFFKGYQLGKRSGNFEDMPVLAGIIWVSTCFMFNIFTVALLASASGAGDFVFERKYKLVFSLGLVLVLILYYTYKKRYLKIIKKYEEKERLKGKGIHPVIVIAVYYILSFFVGMLAGMYKNGDWIFNQSF